MDPTLDSLTGMPMPALNPSHSAGARPNAAAATAGSTGFDRLMGLQQRGRTLEAKLKQQASGASAQDPASMAIAEQRAFYAKQFQEIRELVGPRPGGNARRALAAVLERVEAGGTLKPTDRTRIRLAIAADERRVDLAGANRVRDAIVSLDGAFDAASKGPQDPTLVQDPTRLATFEAQNRRIQQQMEQLEQLVVDGKFDARSVSAIVDSRR